MLQRHYKKKFKGVSVKSGNIYRFKYQPWENDPQPVVIMMYAYTGKHPRTGHEWRFFQAINFTYIPRQDRKKFIEEWISIAGNLNLQTGGGQLKFTWDKVLTKYPYLRNAVRRYFHKPNYYISALEEIPFENWEKVVVSTFAKDFSKKVKSTLVNKYRRVMMNWFNRKRSGKFPRRI